MLPAISYKTTSGINFPSAFSPRKQKNSHHNNQYSGKSQRHFRATQPKIILILPLSNSSHLLTPILYATEALRLGAAWLTHSIPRQKVLDLQDPLQDCRKNERFYLQGQQSASDPCHPPPPRQVARSRRRRGNRLHLFQPWHWKAWPDVGSAHRHWIPYAFSACTP